MPTDTLKAILTSQKASLTHPRLAVFEYLFKNGPASVQEIISGLKAQVDRASVYRALDLFEKAGITHRIITGFKYKVELGEAFIAHHHHMHCLNCGSLTSLPANPLLETMIDSTAKKDGFSPRSHQLEIYGLCINCTALKT
jgi:Fur family transcriptional regulator, ferric uptake regulator